MLNAQLQKEQAIEDIERQERDAHRKETIELQKFARQEADDKAAYERMIDGLVQAENEKQWQQREQRWDREDQARINLLKSVYASREQDIMLKQQKKTESQWMKTYERQNMEDEVQRQNRAYEDQM